MGSSSYSSAQDVMRKSVTIHSFPNPRISQDQFRTWVGLAGASVSGLTDMQIYNNRKVCDKHFAEQDKNRNSRLNALAVPHLHIPKDQFSERENFESQYYKSIALARELSAQHEPPGATSFSSMPDSNTVLGGVCSSECAPSTSAAEHQVPASNNNLEKCKRVESISQRSLFLETIVQ